MQLIATLFIKVDLPEALAPVRTALPLSVKSLVTGSEMSGCAILTADIPLLAYSGLHQFCPLLSMLFLYDATAMSASTPPARFRRQKTSSCLPSMILMIWLNIDTSISSTPQIYSLINARTSPEREACFLPLIPEIIHDIFPRFFKALPASSVMIAQSLSFLSIHLTKSNIFLNSIRELK